MLNSKEERELSYELMDYFNKGPLKIRLKFELRQSSSDCPSQAPSCPYETSDEELSSQSEESSVGRRSYRNGWLYDIGFSKNDWLDEDEIDVFDDNFVFFFIKQNKERAKLFSERNSAVFGLFFSLHL